MANAIQTAKAENKITFSAFMTSNKISNKVNSIIGDKVKGERFVSSIISAVAANPQLAECDNASILSGALLGQALNLSPSPQLGRTYLVPFKDKNRGMVAQFILGYKGYLELAQRSGQYKDINVIEVREGEYKGRDKSTGNPTFEFIEDDDIRNEKDVIGYMATFTLLNGFTKTLYMTKKAMENHAIQYSQGYRADKKNGTSYTFWSKDFDGMAFKTILRQLISKWGILSIDMQRGFEGDMGVIEEDGKINYVDNIKEVNLNEPVEQMPKEVNLSEI